MRQPSIYAQVDSEAGQQTMLNIRAQVDSSCPFGSHPGSGWLTEPRSVS